MGLENTNEIQDNMFSQHWVDHSLIQKGINHSFKTTLSFSHPNEINRICTDIKRKLILRLSD
jgi:hypothetical protein